MQHFTDGEAQGENPLSSVLALGEQLMCLQGADASQTAYELVAAQRDLILATVSRLSGSQASLWLERNLSPRSVKKYSPDGHLAPADQPPSALMRGALQARRTCYALDDQSSAPWSPDDHDRVHDALAVALPLLIQDREAGRASVLGVLQAVRPAGSPFEPDEIELLEGLASQAAIALQSSRQMITERWRLEQLSLVRQVSLQVAGLRDLDELARRVANLILETFDYYYVAIFTLDPGQQRLDLRASAGPARAQDCEHPPYSPVLIAHLGEGIIGHVAQSGEEILAPDVAQEARYRHYDSLPETRSEVSLPLKLEDHVLGVLDVQSDQEDDFDETDMLVLRALADNIASAVDGTRLYSALNQRAEQLAVIYEVSNAISSILDQEELLEVVVDLIHQRFGYPFVHLFSVHPGRRKVIYEAGSGARSQTLCDEGFSLDLDDSSGIIPWVARNGELLLANNVSREPLYQPDGLPPDNTLSELAVPLVFGGHVLGVLDVQSDQVNAFGQEDRFLFETLADNIAVAMRNAALYRSEAWRRQAADSLREVAGLLSAEVDLEQVLAAILVELERNLPLELAAIWLLEEDADLEEACGAPPLYLAAMHGECIADLDLEPGLRPADVLDLSPSPLLEMHREDACAWLGEALAAGNPITRTAESPYEPLGAALDYPADYSAIAAPLRAGEQPLGVLVLAHHTAGRYGGESQAMTAAFASYAAVAIENTRLYESAHEQAWVSTVLLQVAEATQSQTDINELLATVIQITPTLSGVRACLLYIRDEDGFFVPAAASGLDAEQQAEFQRWRFTPEQAPALEQLVAHGSPVVLSEQGPDRRLADILYPHLPAERSPFRAELLVLVPLLVHGEVLGTFLVDYSVDLISGDGYQTLDEFFDERLAIIQGIAHQTAMAVENIRLLKSQKEEAYVSVALLQVAQAVVSSNDLDEALGSIVRITPILVGVKRAAIYLWDAGQSIFWLAQAYGLPRADQPPHYTPGDFPFLYAVYLNDELMACPVSSYESDPQASIVGWPGAPVPDLDEVDAYLEDEACLLLAFPLSVKGRVLGVFLVEEPQPAPQEGFILGSANRRLRAKRLEIITGISQQVALAIQNDALQRETLERERLEGEMQLARDIQRTFLPQQILDLPGWDLQVRWRTARQVGGDFYDYFELPDGRIGLVIADVADKGMPAALFMTLARTLLRATIQEIDSPAEALKRVNEIIVPDAPRGMFVTLAYAVLCLESGELHYANAGHNLPLIVRQASRSIEHFERTGMALGVIEDSPIEERRISLKPGDYLVMYTDGVTEAFSPDGELYGEERLCQTIEYAAVWELAGAQPAEVTAADMLEAIDQSVSDFIGETALSDDLTLLVLKRET